MFLLTFSGAPDSKVHQYFGELVQYIQNGKKNYTLEVANKVYVKSGFSILDTYKKAIDSHYGGLFESVEFTKAQETAKAGTFFLIRDQSILNVYFSALFRRSTILWRTQHMTRSRT
jgi:serine protease inhibitor